MHKDDIHSPQKYCVLECTFLNALLVFLLDFSETNPCPLESQEVPDLD